MRLRPASLCSTLGKADFIRVPLPAAMTTTFNAVSFFTRLLTRAIKPAIIGVALLALTACSAVRLGYNNAPQLAWWSADGYLDFNQAQTPAVKQALDTFFEWHRSTQLVDYAALLVAFQASVLEPTTPAATCRWYAQVRERVEPSIDRLTSQAAELIPTLGEAQFKHLEGRQAKGLEELRRDFLQDSSEERLARSVKRTTERFEQLYGKLDDAQRRVISAGVAASPFDAQVWLAERQRRQRDVLSSLRRLVAEKADREQRTAALRAMAERTERSVDPSYRAYQQRLAEFNCSLAAQVHNATTPAQRARAKQRLRGWEEDLRSLIAPPPS